MTRWWQVGSCARAVGTFGPGPLRSVAPLWSQQSQICPGGAIVIAIVGAGAMGVALASHLARGGHHTTVLATEYDDAVVAAWHQGQPHPALGIVPSSDITLVGPNGWP